MGDWKKNANFGRWEIAKWEMGDEITKCKFDKAIYHMIDYSITIETNGIFICALRCVETAVYALCLRRLIYC